MKMVNWKLKTIAHDVHGTKQQPDPQVDNMSCSPAVVVLLTTRFLFWDRGCQGASRGCRELRHIGSPGCRGFRGHWGGSGVCGYRWPAGDVWALGAGRGCWGYQEV